MEPGAATKLIATLCGLAGFCVACIAGMNAENRATLVLWQSVMSLSLCYTVGYVLGMIGEATVREHTRQLEAASILRETTHETMSALAKTPQNQAHAPPHSTSSQAA